MFIHKNKKLIISVFVDNYIIYSKKGSPEIAKLKEQLNREYDITELGPDIHFLGMRITRDRKRELLWLDQKTYITKVLKRFSIEDYKIRTTPINKDLVLFKEELTLATPEELAEYQSIVGLLIYGIVETKLDIGYTVGVVSRFASNPNAGYLEATKYILRYLKGVLDNTI